MNQPRSSRDPNLDLLRALAITVVVAAHLTVMSPVHHPRLIAVTWSGQFGVDLFFVLSGWLIGGLYFRECIARGRVDPGRFILRRALRTLPPYYVALAVEWPAAYFLKNEHPHFAFSYLIFLQNYIGRLPFFSVSWSLCIEEHFYVIFPIVFGAMRSMLDRAGFFFCAALCLSPLCRMLFYDSPSIDVFDSSVFATHVHLDGLVMGVWAAWMRAFHPRDWSHLAGGCRRWAWLAIIALALVYWIPARLFYCFGYTYVSALFVVLLAAWAGGRALPGATAPWVRAIASSSYSIYLTHSMVLQAARRLAQTTAIWPEGVYYLAALAGTVMVGAGFYFLVERLALRWRDHFVPRLA